MTLDSGETYVIGGFDPGGAGTNDAHVWDTLLAGLPNREVTGFAIDSAITLGAPGTARGPVAAGFEFPVQTVPDT